MITNVEKIRGISFIYYFCQNCNFPKIMRTRRILTAGLTAALVISMLALGSCKAGKVECHAYGEYKNKKKIKNKSSYGKTYGYKAKPAKKTYIIKNKSR